MDIFFLLYLNILYILTAYFKKYKFVRFFFRGKNIYLTFNKMYFLKTGHVSILIESHVSCHTINLPVLIDSIKHRIIEMYIYFIQVSYQLC